MGITANKRQAGGQAVKMDGVTIENDVNRITFLLDGLACRLIKELDTAEKRRQAGLEIWGIEQGFKKIKEICQKD